VGWLTNLLLPGRLRTGPTALLPDRPDPKTLLAIAQLADPEARFDGDDIMAGGSRILAAAELDGEILGKLGVTDEERLWACRLSAEAPLPMDYFDKTLAEGIAYRLGGWSLCRGEPTDLAGSDLRAVRVYLPAAPAPEELVSLLGEVLRPVDSVDAGRWPNGELVDGIVHVTVDGGVVTDVYAGADMMLTIEESNRIPPAAKAHWPYLTEIVIVRLSAVDAEALAPSGEAEEAAVAGTDSVAEPKAEALPENATTGGAQAVGDTPDAEPADGEAVAVGDTADGETAGEDTAGDGREDDDTVGTGAEEGAEGAEGADDDADDTALVERSAVALALANRLQGIATDQAGFQLVEAEDVLPGRYAGQR
jgi:hypothetical protein